MLNEKASLSPQQPLTAQAAIPTPGTGLRLKRQACLRRARHSARVTGPGSADDTNTAVSDPLETAAAQGGVPGYRPQLHRARRLGWARSRSTCDRGASCRPRPPA